MSRDEWFKWWMVGGVLAFAVGMLTEVLFL